MRPFFVPQTHPLPRLGGGSLEALERERPARPRSPSACASRISSQPVTASFASGLDFDAHDGAERAGVARMLRVDLARDERLERRPRRATARSGVGERDRPCAAGGT